MPEVDRSPTEYTENKLTISKLVLPGLDSKCARTQAGVVTYISKARMMRDIEGFR